jgi:acyl dehydratase
MKVGDTAVLKRVITPQMVQQYHRLQGIEEMTVREVPQPLITSMFSYLLGVNLPGPGTNYLKQKNTWHAAAPLNTTLSATVEINRLRPEKNLVNLTTRCIAEDGKLICDGDALVLFRET